MFKIRKECDGCFVVVDGAGVDIAEAQTRHKAKAAADYTTGPLDINQVSHILGAMGWELVDVAAFMATARRLKY